MQRLEMDKEKFYYKIYEASIAFSMGETDFEIHFYIKLVGQQISVLF